MQLRLPMLSETDLHINKPEALKSLYRSPGNKKKPIGPM